MHKKAELIQTNRENWDQRVAGHLEAKEYGLEQFRKGCCTLKEPELQALGKDLSGKTLLHLMCHFGMDSISWSRRGAKVTAVDFSEEAIKAARKLTEEQQQDVEFIVSDVFKLPEKLDQQFDIVFTSYGILCWLYDLNEWANIIAGYLKPGGSFMVIDDHPAANLIEVDSGRLELGEGYFNNGPVKWESQFSYLGDTPLKQSTSTYQWAHSMEEIVNSLIGAGLNIRELKEYPYTYFKRYQNMKLDEEGWYILPNEEKLVPLMFSLLAEKE